MREVPARVKNMGFVSLRNGHFSGKLKDEYLIDMIGMFINLVSTMLSYRILSQNDKRTMDHMILHEFCLVI